MVFSFPIWDAVIMLSALAMTGTRVKLWGGVKKNRQIKFDCQVALEVKNPPANADT